MCRRGDVAGGIFLYKVYLSLNMYQPEHSAIDPDWLLSLIPLPDMSESYFRLRQLLILELRRR